MPEAGWPTRRTSTTTSASPCPPAGRAGAAHPWSGGFQRTPARSAAAFDRFDPAVLAWLADRPAVADGWRAAGAGSPEIRTWWHPGATDGTGQALVAQDGAFVLLTGMDRYGGYGGYGRKEHLDAEGVVSRLPELAAEIERHLREHAADQGACRQARAHGGGLPEGDVPF